MRATHLRRLSIAILTLALLFNPVTIPNTLEAIHTASIQATAVIEMFQAEVGGDKAEAIVVNYNKVEKSYSVKVFINHADNEVTFIKSSGRPFIALSRTFVPYRILAESIDAEVEWNQDKQMVTAVNEDNTKTVEMIIGESRFIVNGTGRTMDVEPFILSAESRCYIPARYLTEGLGHEIDYVKGKDGTMNIVMFTQGQDKEEQQLVLAQIKGEEVETEEGTVPGSSGTGTIGGGTTGNTIPLADARTIQVVGNHYILSGQFDGKYENDKYIITKRPKNIGGGGDVLAIYPNKSFGTIAVTCTSHPEFNTLDYYGDISDMTQERKLYQLSGDGYTIKIVKGMTIEFKAADGDTFTVTI